MKVAWLIIFLVIILGIHRLDAATIDVGPLFPIQSLKESVALASPGDFIVVHEGFYQEGVIIIDKPITVTGIGRPVIDGGHKGHVFYVRADNVTINGLVIQNSGVSDVSEFAGIRVEMSRHCHIADNHFVNTTYAVYLAKVEGCEVVRNEIEGAAKSEVSGGNGLHLWYSKNIQIRDNTIRGHRDGLYLEFSEACQVTNNHVSNNIRYGLHFMFSHENEYIRNIFSDNQTGVAVMYSRHIRMSRNRFEKSWGRSSYGLLLKDIMDSVIEDNEFLANTVGLYADGSNRNRVQKNTFQHNGWAVNILGSSDSNHFERNNFVSNFFHVATNSRASSNQFTENYWNDYRGYDLDRDGVGDIPFRPMKIFSLWVNRFPELVTLLSSPVVEFLEVAERLFPVLTPQALQDARPLMQPVMHIMEAGS